MMKAWIMKTWDCAERAIVGLLGLAALAVALWQVLSRYFFPQQSISYAEEVLVYLLIWGIMIVSSQLVSTDGHVRPDIVRNVVPARAARWMEIFNCAAAIAFCGALTWYGWQIVETARAIDEHSSSDLQFPMWIYYLALPTGAALMSVRYVIRLIAVAGSPGHNPMAQQHPGGHELPGVD
jgi:C4-dicarboxylate transporter DctQ subunit